MPSTRYYFKIVYTSIAHDLLIDDEMTVAQLIHNMNECWRSLFNIHKDYDIEVVASGNAACELAPPIEPSTQIVKDKFNPKTTAFYLRPVHPITEEFIRRDDYSTPHVNNTWSAAGLTTNSTEENVQINTNAIERINPEDIWISPSEELWN